MISNAVYAILKHKFSHKIIFIFIPYNSHPHDKLLLSKCKCLNIKLPFCASLVIERWWNEKYISFVDKDAVEKRLFILQQQGHIYATDDLT